MFAGALIEVVFLVSSLLCHDHMQLECLLSLYATAQYGALQCFSVAIGPITYRELLGSSTSLLFSLYSMTATHKGLAQQSGHLPRHIVIKPIAVWTLAMISH